MIIVENIIVWYLIGIIVDICLMSVTLLIAIHEKRSEGADFSTYKAVTSGLKRLWLSWIGAFLYAIAIILSIVAFVMESVDKLVKTWEKRKK